MQPWGHGRQSCYEESNTFLWERDAYLGASESPGSGETVYRPFTFVPLARTNDETLLLDVDEIGLVLGGLLPNGERYEGLPTDDSGIPVGGAEFGFQGQVRDIETGLHFNRFRYFAPELRRFISKDPLGLGPGPDLYLYAPNPWTWIDPLGLTCTFNQWINRAGQDQDVFVYVGRNQVNEIVYVGISNDLGRRALQHGDRFVMQAIGQSMPRQTARAVEQALIERFGMASRGTGVLRICATRCRRIVSNMVTWYDTVMIGLLTTRSCLGRWT